MQLPEWRTDCEILDRSIDSETAKTKVIEKETFGRAEDHHHQETATAQSNDRGGLEYMREEEVVRANAI